MAPWFQILHGLGHPNLTSLANEVQHDRWQKIPKRWPNHLAPKIRAILLLVFWAIWLERNDRIFRGIAKPVALVLDDIMSEAERWSVVGFL
jgi:hypothetical protein